MKNTVFIAFVLTFLVAMVPAQQAEPLSVATITLPRAAYTHEYRFALTARGGSVHGFNTWYAFILRPDILSTMVLTALVTIGYVMWQQGGRPRG